MKFCRILFENKIIYGRVENGEVFLFPENIDLSEVKQTKNSINKINASEAFFLPPVNPSKIVCVGRNYAEHAAELGNKIPDEPLLFLKAPSSIITNGDKIVIPNQSNQVEHEGELAVIIGEKCKNLTDSDDPQKYIFGFTCLNDVTARDLQKKDIQFTRGKSFDTFCPIGNFIETELNFDDLRITTKVNEVIRQDGRTSQMVFSIPFLIKYISNQMTLNVGDIIATGTPSGVSKMNTGDVVEVEIEGLDILQNFVSN